MSTWAACWGLTTRTSKGDAKRRRPEEDVGFERLKLPDGERPNTDFEGDQEM